MLRAWRRCRLPGGLEVSVGLLDDLRRRDPDTFHRFLWSNHLAYARTYEVHRRFGAANINVTRHLLLDGVTRHLRSRGLDPRREVRSVFDIGCSMGYLLRHLETDIFPGATLLHGLDIDAYAVTAGSAHLAAWRSRVRLIRADLETAAGAMGDRIYDLVLCCGVLMYVNEDTAFAVIRTMMNRARLAGLICLAPPDCNGIPARRSTTRATDGVYYHDVHRMVEDAGGHVVSSHRVGTEISGSSPSHVILAEPYSARRSMRLA
jgi:SAM-dependent methyltransferase